MLIIWAMLTLHKFAYFSWKIEQMQVVMRTTPTYMCGHRFHVFFCKLRTFRDVKTAKTHSFRRNNSKFTSRCSCHARQRMSVATVTLWLLWDEWTRGRHGFIGWSIHGLGSMTLSDGWVGSNDYVIFLATVKITILTRTHRYDTESMNWFLMILSGQDSTVVLSTIRLLVEFTVKWGLRAGLYFIHQEHEIDKKYVAKMLMFQFAWLWVGGLDGSMCR